MKRTLVIALVAAIAVAATSIAYAAIPNSRGVISACVTRDGAVKLIDTDAGQKCPSSQRLVEWNQQGPEGDQGPQGAPGPSAAYVAEGGLSVPLGSGQKTLVTLQLPAGSYLVLGKVRISDASTGDFNHLPASTSCWITGGGAFDSDEVKTNADDSSLNNAFDVGTLSLMTEATPEQQAEVRLECVSVHKVDSLHARISAIKVGELIDQSS